MRSNRESQVRYIARYMLDNNATIRETADKFGYSKSTIHNMMSKELRKYSPSLKHRIAKLFEHHISTRARNGSRVAAHKAKYMSIKLAGVEPSSIVDGPGFRYTIFCQGCIHNCKACHNPETHNFDNGYWEDIGDILDDISHNNLIRGITLSGGDPLYDRNIKAITQLCKEYKKLYPDKTIWLYTGYLWEDILKFNNEFLDYVDVIVDGKFIEDLKSYDVPFKGSSNQRIIDVKNSIRTGNVILYDNL